MFERKLLYAFRGWIAFVAFMDMGTAVRSYIERRSFLGDHSQNQFMAGITKLNTYIYPIIIKENNYLSLNLNQSRGSTSFKYVKYYFSITYTFKINNKILCMSHN